MNRKELSLPEINEKLQGLWKSLSVACVDQDYVLARKTIWTIKWYLGKKEAFSTELEYIPEEEDSTINMNL